MDDNPNMTYTDLAEMRQLYSKDLSRYYFGDWPVQDSQCEHHVIKDITVRCLNKAEFIVHIPSTDDLAQDVCRECLPIVCARYNEVLVMKIKKKE